MMAGGARFAGDITLVRVWPKALNAETVAAVYADLLASLSGS
jgi:hypothetical protein